jgi:hypothetical protein
MFGFAHQVLMTAISRAELLTTASFAKTCHFLIRKD